MIIGTIRAEVHVPNAQSLKDKRSVIKSLKDQLRGRFNIAVAEVEPNEKWQRACVGIVTVGDERAYVDGVLAQVVAALRSNPLITLITLEQECW